MPHEIKMSLISQDSFRTSIFNYCTSNRLFSLPCILSIFVDRCQFKSIWVWTEVSLHFMFAFEFRSVTSDKEWWMWHCHVERSLNVTLPWQPNGWQEVNDADSVWSVEGGDGSRAAQNHASCEQSINHFIQRKGEMRLDGNTVWVPTAVDI